MPPLGSQPIAFKIALHFCRLQQKHRLQRPNNSVKPSPLRGLGPGSYDSATAKAAQRPGLPQALGPQSDFNEPHQAAKPILVSGQGFRLGLDTSENLARLGS